MSLALIGVGNMGKGITRNILSKGSNKLIPQLFLFDTGFNGINEIEKYRNESTISTKILGKTSSIWDLVEIVTLSLPSESICKHILFDETTGIVSTGRASGKKIIIDHGTNSRNFAEDMHQRCEAHGVDYLDAPVSGGPQGAWDGKLTVMVGGNKNSFDSILPYLQLYSSKQVYFGESGCGASAKLINQALVGIHALAACEAIKLAEKWGLTNIDQLNDMLQNSWGQSRILDLVMKEYLQAQFEIFHSQNLDVSKFADVYSKLAQSNSPAPLRNMNKDFQCINNDLQTSNQNFDEDMKQDLLLTKIAGSTIAKACSDNSPNLTNAPFASLVHLLK
jgi:3-hydroxyisobutyrate dehydrogenase-like beta-hydroxyacid dehydrogenase